MINEIYFSKQAWSKPEQLKWSGNILLLMFMYKWHGKKMLLGRLMTGQEEFGLSEVTINCWNLKYWIAEAYLERFFQK